ncbi:MAG: hypothetical protein M9910_09825 [Kiritimatiellae bacterium]|nr:hypothetical protein [Kiritimatiellia bacterium]
MNIRCCVILSVVLVAGCSTVGPQESQTGQSVFPPREPFRLENNETWFSTMELTSRARRYIEKENLPFDLQGADVAVYVNAERGPALVLIAFLHEIGGDVCSVWLDRNGNVIKHAMGKAVD